MGHTLILGVCSMGDILGIHGGYIWAHGLDERLCSLSCHIP